MNNIAGDVLDGNNVVRNDQMSIGTLVEQIGGLVRQMRERGSVIFGRLFTLERKSSQGSQTASTYSDLARPNENRFGVVADQNGGNQG